MNDRVPQRIGDADRDRAAEYLREHLAVGRLTQDEFDERLSSALQARTASDLDPLFVDLPAPKPGEDTASASGSTAWPVYQPPVNQPAAYPTTGPSAALEPMPESKTATVLGIASGVAWAAFIIAVVTGVGPWWLLFIPIVLSTVAGQQRKEQQRREELWQKRQNPQLPPGQPE